MPPSSFFPAPKKLSPTLWSGLRIGILGGSFNPPHAGHIHVSKLALKYLNLDAVWWLVSPGNPLKNNSELPPIKTRMDMCKILTQHHPRLIISNLESQMGTTRSFYTVKALQKHFPKTDFVWLAGTDIAHEMHKWHRPFDTLNKIPFAFIGRGSATNLCRQTYPKRLTKFPHKSLINQSKSPLIGRQIFWILADAKHPESSSQIRAHNTN